jgi:hypothetical protein
MRAPSADFVQLREEIQSEMAQLVAVATGGADIREVNSLYQERRRRVKDGLERYALRDPNHWRDLWLWYEEWRSNPALGTYQSRRVHILTAYQPVLEALDRLERDRRLGTELDEESGWAGIDQEVSELRDAFAVARTVSDFKAIGLRSRELLISLGRAAYDASTHVPGEQPVPADDDAKTRLHQIIQFELKGKANADIRNVLREAVRRGWRAACNLTHDRNATYVKAFVVANSSLFLLNAIATLVRFVERPEDLSAEEEEESSTDWIDADTPPELSRFSAIDDPVERYGWDETVGGPP